MAKQVLNNVKGIILYAAIQEPKNKYKSEETEWSVQVAVDKETAKAWKKAYKKQPVKEFDRDEFMSQFKLTELHSSYDDVDEFYVVTLKRGTKMKDKKTGEMVPVPDNIGPKVLLRKGSIQEDITKTKLVANGSLGVVSIFHKESAEFGDSAGLKNVLITDLIEYVKSGAAGDEFGEFMEDGGEEDEFGDDAPEEKPAKAAKAEKQAAKEVVKPETDDDSLPF